MTLGLRVHIAKLVEAQLLSVASISGSDRLVLMMMCKVLPSARLPRPLDLLSESALSIKLSLHRTSVLQTIGRVAAEQSKSESLAALLPEVRQCYFISFHRPIFFTAQCSARCGCLSMHCLMAGGAGGDRGDSAEHPALD